MIRPMKSAIFDPEVKELIVKETRRQSEVLEMIPSENYASAAVREAVSSVFINKYAEGTVGKRFYQGNWVVDELEALCKQRALELFKLSEKKWGVNVQALSGSPANLAVYNALLQPGDRIMSMYLPDGGHLSHGWELPDKKVTLVSKTWEITFYHVDRVTRVFNYEKIRELAVRLKPKMLISGGTAYPREINHQKMGEIAHAVGAYYMADIAHEAGLVAAGVNTSPFPFADVVTMTTHKTLRGPRGAMIFTRRTSEAKLDYQTEENLDKSVLVDQSVFPGIQGGPHEHTIAGVAVALGEALKPEFKEYAKQVVKNAQVLAEIFLKNGFDVVSGGTDKHLILLDLRSVKTSAWIAAWALEYANIVVNRNTVPYETGSSFYPSGIRLGTPAVTTRGMKEKEMQIIGEWMMEVFREVAHYRIPENKDERQQFRKSVRQELEMNKLLQSIAGSVKLLTQKYPVP